MKNTRMVYQTEATRSKILAAAEPMFVEKGFDDTQMKDIALAIDMSRNTLYCYYQDKFDLGFAILVSVLKRQGKKTIDYMDALRAKGLASTIDSLRALLLSLCDEESKVDARFMAEFDAYYSGERIPDTFRDTLKEAIAEDLHGTVFDQLIAQGQEQGEIRSDLTSRQISVILLNAVPIFHRRMILRQNALVEIDAPEVPALTPAFIDILLNGLRPVPSKKESN